MTKRFVISTETMTAEEELALAKKFKQISPKCGWWHWLPNFWLVVDHSDVATTILLRDAIHDINPQTRAFIAHVENTQWAALTKPDAKGNDMARWLRETWQDAD